MVRHQRVMGTCVGESDFHICWRLRDARYHRAVTDVVAQRVRHSVRQEIVAAADLPHHWNSVANGIMNKIEQ